MKHIRFAEIYSIGSNDFKFPKLEELITVHLENNENRWDILDSQAPWYVSFFLSFAYLSPKCLFVLRTTVMTTNGHHHHHRTPSPSPEWMQAWDASMSRVLVCKIFFFFFFFFALLNNYLLIDCVYGTATRMTMANGHHLWDDEWGLETHLCLESLVTGWYVFFFLRYVFSFLFFYYSFNLPRRVHYHTLSNSNDNDNRDSRHVASQVPKEETYH